MIVYEQVPALDRYHDCLGARRNSFELSVLKRNKEALNSVQLIRLTTFDSSTSFFQDCIVSAERYSDFQKKAFFEIDISAGIVSPVLSKYSSFCFDDDCGGQYWY